MHDLLFFLLQDVTFSRFGSKTDIELLSPEILRSNFFVWGCKRKRERERERERERATADRSPIDLNMSPEDQSLWQLRVTGAHICISSGPA